MLVANRLKRSAAITATQKLTGGSDPKRKKTQSDETAVASTSASSRNDSDKRASCTGQSNSNLGRDSEISQNPVSREEPLDSSSESGQDEVSDDGLESDQDEVSGEGRPFFFSSLFKLFGCIF